MRIPFDIKFRPQIESGEYKVETRNGNPIRVLAWDLPNDFPIATAEFTEDNRVIVESYSADGWVGYGEKENNLFIITPESELSEFEKGCIRLYQDGRDDGFAGDNLSDEALKESAAELLELARKELRDEIEFRGEEYQTGYKEGKAEALKDLPRWKKCEHEMHTLTHLLIRSIDAMWIGAYVKEGQYYIPTNDLILKLPGFKED